MAQDIAAETLTAICAGLCSDYVGETLKAIYNEALAEPVPDDFVALIQRLSDGGCGERH